MNKFLGILFVLVFLSCGIKELTIPKDKEVSSGDSIAHDQNKVDDLSVKLSLNIEEKETLDFFVKILKDECSKTINETNVRFKYKVNDINKIEEYVEQFFLELNDSYKAKELLYIIKNARENPGVGGLDMIKSGIVGAFDIFFDDIVGRSALVTFNGIKIACEAYKKQSVKSG
ncbi:hypothetical protein [Borrelia persica]|uniref:hypothetical protein n=1 Tax=Borrelia persica TaxID=44448 RepID=UPI0004641CA6|nr:hypothetical protein [Borrelia persica]